MAMEAHVPDASAAQLDEEDDEVTFHDIETLQANGVSMADSTLLTSPPPHHSLLCAPRSHFVLS
jgi:hypothetical protein